MDYVAAFSPKEPTEVMVVDDVVSTLHLLSGGLQQVGYGVRVVPSGSVALKAVRNKRPDCILLDVDMPDIDGFEVCRTLKKDPRTRSIPIIFISAHSDSDLKMEAYSIGGVDFISKPIDLTEVLAKVATHVSHARAMSERDYEVYVTSELSKFANAIIRKSNLSDIIDILISTAMNLTGSTYAFACRITMDSLEPELPVMRTPRRSPIPTQTVRKGFYKLVRNIRLSQDILSSHALENLPTRVMPAPVPFSSYLMVPAVFKEEVVGLLIVAEPTKIYSERDVEFLLSLVYYFAIALDKHAFTQERLNRAHEALRREVGDRVEAQEMAKRAYSELEQIFQKINLGMQILDTNFTIVKQNKAMEELSGSPMRENVGKHCWEVLHTSACFSDRCFVSSILMGNSTTTEVDAEVLRADGHTLTCLMSAIPFLDDQQEPVGILEIYQDVTENRRLESIAQAVNTMSNIGYVFSGIRHELGNPVNALKMTLSVLLRRLSGFSEEEIRNFVERAMKDISRLEYLLKSLKSYSMFESLEVTPINLCAHMREFYALVQKDLQAKGIHLDITACSEQYHIRADARALQQVLLNIFTNAMDALEGRENPVIAVHGEVDKSESVVTLTVRDNGVGMTEKQLSELFRPFYTNKKHGTGLGLVLVRKMLAQMNALISVSSLKGEGTTVILTFESGGAAPQ